MKKILSAAQLQATDEFTIAEEPITSIELMERASVRFVEHFIQIIQPPCAVFVVIGPGNNGGDGLAIARLLSDEGYAVRVGMLPGTLIAKDAQTNLERLPYSIELLEDSVLFEKSDVIIDALFGSGLNRPLEGSYKLLVNRINEAKKVIVAVDVPSGLIADQIVDPTSAVVKANYTFTFQRPKLTFLIPETGCYCGRLSVLDIGLNEDFMEMQDTTCLLLEAKDVRLPDRLKFAHKGNYGHAQVFAGSKGKMGAAVLSTKATLAVGVGLVTAHVPARGEVVLQTSIPEAMVLLDEHDDVITSGTLSSRTNAVCIGPGIGISKQTATWLSAFLSQLELPVVLDADAINIVAQRPSLLDFIKGKAILTPHLGELARLIGPTAHGLERIEKAKAFARKHDLVILIKGAYSAVISPEGKVFFNPTGNPGMSKAGSGDVLAGMITGFLSQGYSREAAVIRGVYFHGTAGDLAENELNEYSILASDLLRNIPLALSNV